MGEWPLLRLFNPQQYIKYSILAAKQFLTENKVNIAEKDEILRDIDNIEKWMKGEKILDSEIEWHIILFNLTIERIIFRLTNNHSYNKNNLVIKVLNLGVPILEKGENSEQNKAL